MVTRYVNTASTVGGNGTTNDIVGANRAYAKLDEAEIALRTLNAADDLEILCCGSVADTTPVQFFTYTYTQAGYTVYIKANRNDPAGYHGGKWNESTYRLQPSASYIINKQNNLSSFVFDGIQAYSNLSGNQIIIQDVSSYTTCFKNCIVKLGSNPVCIFSNYLHTGTGIISFENCTFIGTNNTYGIFHYAGTMHVYNCIVNGFVSGIIRFAGGTVTVKNSEVFDNNNDFAGTITVDHCASDDGDGTNPISVSIWADQFYNANYLADIDFRLKDTSVLLNAGIGPDVDANVPINDILDYDRAGDTATVGPFEHEWDYSESSSIVNNIQFFGQLHGQLFGQD